MDQVQPIEQGAAVSFVTPNQFELRGGDVHVSFSATSFSGEPLLQYRDRRHQVNARGDEITQVDVGIGTLVTVTLEPNADAGALLFSVLIPHARITGKDDHVNINTLGILTRTGGFIIDTRQLDTYTEVRLTGEGRFVVA
ncbi:hypothetical protein [Vitiosangium sp. GDMCC 1.1324]|uniref:hypothetical protein n=1 Tax=Vitiosangium sp. (strain GDMCC 1.1324) TaxID=2138576 RepID=UPI000D347841|nr:hypothetical protein [Vitiosangium sp. GDMCC 1.1324]PTL79568.1 hypothetical protein DAT35_32660 [Vitiosangium sp. GDMCC 1.1324]